MRDTRYPVFVGIEHVFAVVTALRDVVRWPRKHGSGNPSREKSSARSTVHLSEITWLRSPSPEPQNLNSCQLPIIELTTPGARNIIALKNDFTMTSVRSSFSVGVLLTCSYYVTVSTALGQTYSPLLAPSTTYNDLFVAYCSSGGYIIPNCDMTASTDYYEDTNAHTESQHAGSAPLSTVSPSSFNTGASGYVYVTLTTTAVGHAEYARFCASGGCTDLDYAVGDTLYWVSDHGIWTHVGARVEHGNSVNYNHWMKTYPAYQFYCTTVDYQAEYPGSVAANDMSLPFGGYFDIDGYWTTGPHASHRTGADVDINGTNDAFLDFCLDNGATYVTKHGPGNLHCRWAEYGTHCLE